MGHLKTKPMKVTTLEPKITDVLQAQRVTGDEPPKELESDKLDKILAAIYHTRECLETKTDSVAVGLNRLRDDHRKLADRVTHSEKGIMVLKPVVVDVQKDIDRLSR